MKKSIVSDHDRWSETKSINYNIWACKYPASWRCPGPIPPGYALPAAIPIFGFSWRQPLG
jgi:hypothetical protein